MTACNSKPPSKSDFEDFEIKKFHTEITESLAYREIRGCGEYSYRRHKDDDSMFLVSCYDENRTQKDYLVLPNIKSVLEID